MSRLWDRGEPVDERVARFTAGRDPQTDLRLVPYDALASFAHATMLAEIGVLDATDLPPLRAELAAIAAECRAGTFAIAADEEDGHTAIENRLAARLGDTGRRIHTGRSRNDQVLAALRLFAREALIAVAGEALAVAELLVDLADRHREVSLPGYTHVPPGGAVDPGVPLRRPRRRAGRRPALAAHRLRPRRPLAAGERRRLRRTAGPRPRSGGRALSFARRRARPAVQNDRGKTEFLVLGAALTAVLDAGWPPT